MKCQACQTPIREKVNKLKVIHGVQIYSCPECGLGFVSHDTPRRPTHEIYSFADYDARRFQFETRYKGIIKKINNLYVDRPNRKQIHILEVGAGFGLLSKMVADEGYTVTALEPYLKPDYLQKTSVKHIQVRLSEYTTQTRTTYDCIILFDVLEHVDNLDATLQEVRKLLNRGGVLIVQTPNYASVMQYLSKDWSWWMIEDHRFFFTKQSINRLLTRNLFSVLFYSSYEDWEDYIKNCTGWTTTIQSTVLRKIAKLLVYIYSGVIRIIVQPFYSLAFGGLHLIIAKKYN